MVEPLNPVTLTLLCVAEIQSGDDDGALATARKIHQLPHEGYPLVHYIAGQALEHKGKPQQAYAEYETYLSEVTERGRGAAGAKCAGAAHRRRQTGSPVDCCGSFRCRPRDACCILVQLP